MDGPEALIPVVLAPREVAGIGIPDLTVAAAPHVLGDAPGVVLDLSQVVHITSAGLGAIVRIGMDLREREAVLALAAPGRGVARLLEIVGFDTVMPVFRTVELAQAHVRSLAARAG